MAENNNRWWEFYLTRYLAANMFAVLVLFYLVAFHGDDIQKNLCFDKFELQLCEKKFSSQVFDFIFQTTKDVKYTNDNVLYIEEVCTQGISCQNVFLPVPNKPKSDNSIAVIESGFILNKDSQINITEINFANIFVLGVFSFLYMYISSIPIYFLHITRPYIGSGIFEFLQESTKRRDKIEKNRDWEFAPEYVTSYKHMREHGNAFGIILMEILFAWFLVLTDFSLFLIISWLFLGFSGWFLGIYLEFKMIGKNHAYFLIGVFLFFYILSLMLFCIRTEGL
jgi:hypothetical protein